MKAMLHIPHANLRFPEAFWEGVLISLEALERYNMEHTDLYIEELFENPYFEKVVAPYSRLYCDVERFRDDALESMSRYGQGFLYTHMYDGNRFHRHSAAYRSQVLHYYDEHHRKLDELAVRMTATKEKLLILDCHSFKDSVARHFFEGEFPDIDLGVEPDFYDETILEMIKTHFLMHEYTVELNHPYKGALVPNIIYQTKPKNVVSIMIEINKRIYLNDDNSINETKYNELRSVIVELLKTIHAL